MSERVASLLLLTPTWAQAWCWFTKGQVQLFLLEAFWFLFPLSSFIFRRSRLIGQERLGLREPGAAGRSWFWPTNTVWRSVPPPIHSTPAASAVE